MRFLSFACVLFSTVVAVWSQTANEDNGSVKEIQWGLLSDRNVTPLGQAALGIRATEWKHTETKNFIYHYFQSFIVGPVMTEAEFYYNVISKDLAKDTTSWERKSHIFVFETPEDWAQFQGRGKLDPWTGGICAGNELFIVRNPKYKFKGNTLGHEVAHLVVFRFFGNGVPIWLNEGYAEFSSSKGYAAFYRARGYRAKPSVQSVPPALFIPLDELVNAVGYPQADEKVPVFYSESERLVRFLSGIDKKGFATMFEALSQGNRFESALSKGYSNRFFDLKALEQQFKEYATKEHGSSLQDQE
jgi:hypothetical protein